MNIIINNSVMIKQNPYFQIMNLIKKKNFKFIKIILKKKYKKEKVLTLKNNIFK